MLSELQVTEKKVCSLKRRQFRLQGWLTRQLCGTVSHSPLCHPLRPLLSFSSQKTTVSNPGGYVCLCPSLAGGGTLLPSCGLKLDGGNYGEEPSLDQ